MPSDAPSDVTPAPRPAAPTVHTTTSPGRRRAAVRAAAAGAALSALALTVLWVVSQHTVAGQRLDAGAFRAAADVHDVLVGPAGLVRTVLPVLALGAVAVLGALALVRRRWAALARAAAVVVGTVLLTEAWQTLVPRPDLGGHGYAHNTFPSGHVAAVAAAAVAAVLLWPGRGRGGVLTAGLVAALVVAAASVVTYAHRPSDVVGAVLVTVLVTCVVLVVAAGRARTGPRSGPRPAPR